MNRSRVKQLLPQGIAWAAMVVLCGGLTVAQAQNQQTDATQVPTGQRTDGQI